MSTIAVGSADGLHLLDPDGSRRVELAGRQVDALAVDDDGGWWALVDRQSIWRRDGDEWTRALHSDDHRLTCLLVRPGGRVLAGTVGGHLLSAADDRLELLSPFEEVEGRDDWYTPWGAPADVRSMTRTSTGSLLVNVHVGGIVRSGDDGASWSPTVDVDADVHEVVTAPDGRAVAAAAVGLLTSDDDGRGWETTTDGLHATYARAVAVRDGTLLVSASTGPSTRRAAVYRRREDGALERCGDGLPEWFETNVDTRCLAVGGDTAAFATGTGDVYRSDDGGRRWQHAASGLREPWCVAVF